MGEAWCSRRCRTWARNGLWMGLFLLTHGIEAGAASFDTSFGDAGVVLTQLVSDPTYGIGNGVALQADGKILVCALSDGGDLVLLRYNANGTLDASFAGDGELALAGAGRCQGVVVQADGKIVTASAGTRPSSSGTGFSVRRFLDDGTLDAGFDGDGVAVAEIGTSNYPTSLRLQADGKIVVAGSASYGSLGNSHIAVARFHSDGSLDAAFDADGTVLTALRFGEGANHVAVQGDGKIVVVGSSYRGFGGSDLFVLRYNADGSLDSTFDGDGSVITPVGPDSSGGLQVAVQADGRIVVAGQFTFTDATFNSSGDMLLLRYESDGSIDTSFAASGLFTQSMGDVDTASALALQADGKIIVGGGVMDHVDFRTRAVAFRLNPDGSLDNSFDGDGRMLFRVGFDDPINAVAIQADGSIVFAGRSVQVPTVDAPVSMVTLFRFLGTSVCALPATGCLVAPKAALSFVDAEQGERDKLSWAWKKGAAVEALELGDPTSDSDYTLCLYANGSNIWDADLLPRGSWSGTRSGYVFKDKASRSGISAASLKAGEAGRSQVKLKGLGGWLLDLSMPLATPVTVQLRKRNAALCFESTFTDSETTRNSDTSFRGKL